MAFKAIPGVEAVGFADVPGVERGNAQEALSKFEREIARAVITVANTGVDPAWVSKYLFTMAEGMGMEGAGPIADAFQDPEHGMPELNPKVRELGGNPNGWMKLKLRAILGALGGRLGVLKTHKIATEEEELAEMTAGIPVLGGKRTIN